MSEEKSKRRRKRSSKLKERKQKEARERAAKREAEAKERLRKWEECWDRKYQAQAEREHAECCIDKGYCLKPRTQSNIWINVTQDRSIQEIQMAFKHVPVPKPKPPPLPPLKMYAATTTTTTKVDKALVQKKLQKIDKKIGTARRKRSKK